ncbi:hypothetical protein HMPREF0294_2169 [Corynebacterium glucuronolyticum ATCC 51867]|nr:hypothetical protein HMPREF0294_2169 [Corynebacterium glucuronolyticum ATCC 51867]
MPTQVSKRVHEKLTWGLLSKITPIYLRVCGFVGVWFIVVFTASGA